MVGVPSSRGCSTCRTRKLKCDEARPSCYQCRRGGRKCPGYQPRLKFVDESAKFQGKVGHEPFPSSTETAAKSSSLPVERKALTYQRSLFVKSIAVTPQTGKTNSEISQDSSSASNVRSLNAPRLSSSRLSLRSLEQKGIVASFVQDLFPLGRVTVQHSFIGSWLWHVPEFLHKNHAMDLAAESLALTYFAKKADSTDILIRSYHVHAEALRNLLDALENHRSRFASETLCAILLLVHFENFVAMRNKSWISHAGAAGRLIQLRGPDRHRYGFDCAMFMASRGYLISQAVATGSQCFLDDDEWRSIQVDDDSFPLMPDNSTIYHEGLNHFAKIPGIMEKFQCLINGEPFADHASIYYEAKKVRSNMMEWFEKLQSDFRVPIRVLMPLPPSPHMIFPSVYEYRDIITATFVVNYSAYLLRVNTLLDYLEGSNHNLEENTALSENICMSATYCSRAGFCGAQAMAFALPLALSALPQRYTGWIQHQINVFECVQESFTLRSALLDKSG